MTGIVSYGAYVPYLRISRQAIAAAWGSGGGKGERSVANFDEDSATLAAEAAADCLVGFDKQDIDGLYFASTTSPYKEKQSASIVSGAADLRRNCRTGDYTNSLRAGSVALRAAIDAVAGGSAKKMLVAAADCRLGFPRSDMEQNLGDGAAALLVGNTDVIATVDDVYSHSDEIMEYWRAENDAFVQAWEDRFIMTEGYVLNMTEGLNAIMKKNKLAAKDFARLVFYAPNAGAHGNIARSCGFQPGQIQNPLFDTIGNTGAAHAMMVLVGALETAKPGERILFASHGDGCDAFILTVTDAITKLKPRRGLKGFSASKNMLSSYEKFLRFRDLVAGEAARRNPEPTSAPAMWRDRKMVLNLHGGKCKSCGNPQFPIQRVCAYCSAKDNIEEFPLSTQKAHLFTYTKDNLASTADSPMVKTVIDFEGGARMFCEMTDRDPEKVAIGMPVEMTFRRARDAGGFHNYFWKCRPVR